MKPLTAVLVTGPANGSLTLNSNGHFVYTPTLGYAGSDSFVYKAFDGTDYSSNTTVSLTLTKPLSATALPEDRPSAGVQATGVVGTSSFTGEVQAGQRIEDGYSLSYESLSDPRPVIAVETTYTSANPSNKFEVQLTFNGVAQTSVWYTASTMNNNVRFAVQADASSLATGRYPWQMKIIGRYTNGDTATHLYSGNAEIVNLNASNFGDNWTVRELDRLVPQTGGVLLARGDGITAWFTSGSGGAFTSPVGPFGTVTLVQNTDSTYRLTDKFGNKANFSAIGLLTSRVDRNSNTTSFAYIDADSDSIADELSTITDPWSRVTTFAYSSGLLASVTDNASRVTSITTDSQGRVTAITAPDPDGSGSLSAPVTSYGYSGTTRRLTSVTDPLSHVTQIAYDFAGRLSSVTDAASTAFAFAIWQTRSLPNSSTGQGTETNPMTFYVPDGTFGTQSNGISGTDSTRFDRFGFPTSFKDALNNTTTWTRNSNGLATQMTQPGSIVTSYQYNSAQNLTQITHPGGSTQSWVYSSTLNQPTSATNELSKTTTFCYDTYGNLLTATSPLGYVTTNTYNSRGQVLTVTAPDPDGAGSLTSSVTSFSYDTLGRLTTITNPDTSTQQRGYDSANRITSQTDELGRVTTIAYDNLDRVTSITQPDPDGSGSLSAPVTTLAYNAVGNVTSKTDPLGRVTSFSYDVLNRRTQTTLPDPDGSGSLTSPVYAQAYNAASQITSQTDALGHVTTYAYNSAGQNTSITQPDPDGSGSLTAPVTSFLYDSLGRRTRITDPLSRQTNFEYSARGWLTKRTDPDPDGTGSLTSPVTVWTYNAGGQLTSITDPLSRVTSFAYDNDGRQTSVTLPDPDGSGSLTAPVLSTSYDNLGRVLTQTNPLGKVTAFAYDNRSRLTQRTYPDPDGSGSLTSPVTQWAFDAAGQRTSATDSLGQVTSFAYDNLGRRKQITSPDPDGAGSLTAPVTSFTFDAVNNVLTQTDPLGNVTSFSYDNLNRLLVRTEPDPDGAGSATAPVTTFVYNAVGNLTTLTDPVGNMTSWVYDNLQRQTSETNALNATRSWVFDAAGNVTKSTDRNGRIREFTFDGLNRITQEQWKNGTTVVNTITQVFDAASQLTSTSDSSAALAFSYDNLGRATSISNSGTPSVPTVVLSNTFDAASRRTGLSATINSTADFANAYSYDNLGRMTQVTQQGQSGGNTVAAKRVDLTYHANGQFSTISRYANLTATQLVAITTYSFDQANRLTSLTHTRGAASLAAYSWTFDATSRITAATTPDGTATYSYDNNGQLTGADHSVETDESYSYDANGNRTMSGYTTGTNNRLTSDGTSNYTYDSEGNRTRKTNIASGAYVDYAWDHRNRLTSVTYKTSGGTTTTKVEYTYDTLNRRVSKSVDDNGNGTIDRAEYFVYDNAGKPDPNVGVPLDDIVLVFRDADGSGSGLSSLSSRLLHGPAIDQVFATESSTNEVLWSLTDHQGTVRDVAKYNSGTDTTSIVNHLKYDSFGKVLSQTNSSYQPLHTYTGREWDADANLFYYRARWYDPIVGRFIGEDPITFAAGDTNLSRYVGNSSLSLLDPSGMSGITMPWGWDLESLRAGAAAAAVAARAAAARAAAAVAEAAVARAGTIAITIGGPVVAVILVMSPTDAGRGSERTSEEIANADATKAAIDKLLDGATDRKVGKTIQVNKPGGLDGANNDFDEAVGNATIKDHGAGIRSSTLPDGSTISVRPNSTEGSPTIQIDPLSGKSIKIRFPEGE